MSAELLENQHTKKFERLLRLFREDRERSRQGQWTAFDELLEVSARPFERPPLDLYSSEVKPLVLNTVVSLEGVVYLNAVCGATQRRVSADLHEGGDFQELATPENHEALIPLDTLLKSAPHE